MSNMKRNIFQTAKFTSKMGRYTITRERFDISVQIYDKDGNIICRYCETLSKRISIKRLCTESTEYHPTAYRIELSTSPADWCALYDTKGRKVKQIYG